MRDLVTDVSRAGSTISFDAEPDTTVRRPIRMEAVGLKHAPSYWAATAGEEVAASGELPDEREVDVAIIGAGFTGVSCAYHLAKEHGIKATVLDANRVGWGGSGRNGGFAMICVGKDEYADTLAKCSPEEAQKHFCVGLDAVRTVEQIIADNALQVDRTQDGWICIAHKPSRLHELQATQRLLCDGFGYRTEIIGGQELRSRLIDNTEAHGAIIYPDGFGLHPLKYVRGLARAALQHGATIHTGSPVIGWEKQGKRHVLRTPKGALKASQVLIATAGYTLDSLHPWLSGRVLPAISNIVVTRPLTAQEQAAAGLCTTQMVSDTRRLVFYYRLLPDGRFLFGARGGIEDAAAQNEKSFRWLTRRMLEQFPGLRGVEADYFWRGWLCLSRDKNPHIGVTDDPTVHYAIAYIGNGVALASHFGRLTAGRIAGRQCEPDIALLKTPLPRFEIPIAREAALRAAYAYYAIKDRFL